VFVLSLIVALVSLQPVFTSGVTIVRVEVAVSDRNGDIADLAQRDFALFEDGMPQPIVDFAVVRIRAPRADRLRGARREPPAGQGSRPRRVVDVPLPPAVQPPLTYYVISYTAPASGVDGAFHRLEVRVKRPGVQVRAPEGYVAR
jgi:hypothetical protein